MDSINHFSELLNADVETQMIYLLKALVDKGVIKPEDLTGEPQYGPNGEEIFEGNNPMRVELRRDQLKVLGDKRAKDKT